MAITILTTPQQISSVNNQMIYTISSDHAASPNFNFVADIFVSGTNQCRLKYPIQPSSIQLQFDIGNVLKNYVTYDFIGNFGFPINRCQMSEVKYYVQFGEQYDVSGIPTLYLNLAHDPSSGLRVGINSVFDFLSFSTLILDSYDVSVGKFMNTNYVQKIRSTDNKLLTFLDKNRIIDHYIIYFLDSAGNLINTGVTPTSLSLPGYVDDILFNLDLQTLIAANGGLPSNTATINVILLQSGTPMANYIITIDNSCSQFDIFRLHWLNKLNGWDTFNFTKASQKTSNITRMQYKSILPLGYVHSDRLKKNYNTEIIDSINLQSDWVSDDESLLLQQLAESPIIYLENLDGSFTSINITDTSYVTKKWINGRALFNVVFNIEYTFNRYTQTL